MADLQKRATAMIASRMSGRVAFGFALVVGFSLLCAKGSLAQTGGPEGYVALPDGEVSRHGSITARLIDPTTRYDHGVLGDAIEAGGFMVERGGARLIYRLPADAVFEDRRVRLADLDGDGVPEAIVVKAYLSRGAAIAVYRILPDRIEPLAESAPIGMRNRWLNPVGIADFTGSGEAMIAAVVTPHLAGSLRLYRLDGKTLSEVTRIDGYTNHIIGARDLDLASVVQVGRGKQPLIVIPTLDRHTLATISLTGGNPVVQSRWTLPNRIERLRVDPTQRATVSGSFGERHIDLRSEGGSIR